MLIILGVLLALAGLGITLAGGALLVAHGAFEKDGFLTTGSERVVADVVALTSESFDVREIDEWPFNDELRLRVTIDDAREPVLVGIAPTAELEAALDDASRATVRFDDGPWGSLRYDETGDSDSLATAPVDLVDWGAYAVGTGEQQVTWDLADGDWSIVLLNADGSVGIDERVSVGVDLPYVVPTGWTLLGIGLAVSAIAALLIALGSRRPGAAAASSAPSTTGATANTASHVRGPLLVEARIDSPSRGLWLVKWLLLIPHAIVLALLWTAVAVVTVVAWFAVVIGGRYPESLHRFVEGVARWTWRVLAYGYGSLSTDRYPPFSLEHHDDYPATLQLERAEHLSRLLPFVKWVLLVPHFMLAGAIGGTTYVAANGDVYGQASLASVLAIIAGVGLLFTGSLPRGVFDLMVGIARWGWRVFAYGALLTDHYPPFRLDQGGREPDAPRSEAIASGEDAAPLQR